ncbi:DUF3152 domain-containing protein [Streptomyces barringtoniae]|uniref:DUF3152 domain-containing protein n=1 Tax=Streptomyces barringtoniae TaxID=2892029 RepID=UPI001E37244D|nr:DUF3152 domain-containing protein [Streptomyces barringtoniae]MCC5478875.1 DUF3152 domain-containing protein [Streptomyces barringtoniae]
MGRHSRRGPSPKDDSADIPAARRKGGTRGGQPLPGRRQAPTDGAGTGAGAAGYPPRGPQETPTFPQGAAPRSGEGTPVRGVPRLPDGTPAQGVPGFPDGTPAQGVPRFGEGTPARGVPRMPGGGPARGVPGFPEGTPAHGVPRLPDGTPAHGVPRLPDGTPAHGVPRLPDGTPAHGVPRLREGAPTRGGHPEQREAGGGWGRFPGAAGPGVVIPRPRPGGPGAGSGPRQEYLDAFTDGRGGGVVLDEDIDVFTPRTGSPRPAEGHPADTPEADADDASPSGPPAEPPAGLPAQRTGGKGRAFTGIAAAAVTTVLAVVVAGQVTGSHHDGGAGSNSATDQARDARTPGGETPSAPPGTVTLSYEQKMDLKYPLSATLKGSGKFAAVPGFAKAPGTGQKYTYRVDVEQGLGLDGELFAEAVQKTLNDDRSWAHGGARTFERISSGKPDFVITLASPGTTAKWCAKSGLDTTEDNVSCDSAATERVMINAYRWAQGSKTYGDKMYAYRQMLINHEVGHRLGHGHVTCQKDGELAPVMQQQTKFLDHDGIHCLPNPWPYPRS